MKKYLLQNKVLLSIILILLVTNFFFAYTYHTDNTSISDVYETEESTTESVKVDEFVSFGIKNVLPSEGFKTGLSYYPKLTWYNTVIKQEEPQVDIGVSYPKFIGGTTVQKLNQYIFDLISSKIEEDRKEVSSIPSDERLSNDRISLTSTYKVVAVTKGVVSIEIVLTDFTGGGNGNHDNSITINWDLKSNRLLKNSELFCNKNYVDKLIPITQENAFKQFYGIETKDYIPNEMNSWTKEGIANKVDNWDNFLIANNGLVVVFQPYRVSSGASGVERVFIDNKDIPNTVCLP